MTTFSTVTNKNDILKSVAPFLSAQPAFGFIYSGNMVKLHLNTDLPKNDIAVLTNKTYNVSRSYTTAFVQFDLDSGRNIGFEFNKYFAETLDNIERSFVFAHEAMHVLLDHGKRGREFLETLPEDKRNHKILNVAMDVCINELLIREVFHSHAPYMDILKTMCLIDTIFTKKGIIVEEGKSFQYYYNMILDNMDKFGGGFSETMFGDVAADMPEWAKDMLGDIAKSGGMTDANAAGKLRGGSGQGSGTVAKEPVVTQFRKMNIEDAITRYIKPRNLSSIDRKAPSKTKYTWHGMERRNVLMGHHHPEISIPIRSVSTKNKKMKVLVYCDVSGSVESYTKKFLSIIDLIDNADSEVITYVWADSVSLAKKIANDKFKWNGCGGGTNIKSVFDHFYANHSDDKVDAVVVLTDGEYENIAKYKLKGSFDHTKWKFFMTSSSHIKNVIDKSISVEIDWDHYGKV